MTAPDAVQASLRAGADMVGFVLFPPSPRHLDIAQAGELARCAAGATRVALTVDADDDLIAGIAAEGTFDAIQLQGSEPPERVAQVRARTGLLVMKAIGVATAQDLPQIERFASRASPVEWASSRRETGDTACRRARMTTDHRPGGLPHRPRPLPDRGDRRDRGR